MLRFVENKLEESSLPEIWETEEEKQLSDQELKNRNFKWALNNNIEKVIYFRQHCRINGNNYTAVITVKVYASQNYHKYYHHYLDDFLLEPGK